MSQSMDYRKFISEWFPVSTLFNTMVINKYLEHHHRLCEEYLVVSNTIHQLRSSIMSDGCVEKFLWFIKKSSKCIPMKIEFQLYWTKKSFVYLVYLSTISSRELSIQKQKIQSIWKKKKSHIFCWNSHRVNYHW